jgi:4-hydroxybenzoate polyprenyltransferase
MDKEWQNGLPYLLLKSARPRQWIKNFALYAALVFSGLFFFTPPDEFPYVVTVTFAFFIFSLLTSAIYIANDILDVEADKLHPFKKRRPIASGKLPVPVAMYAVIFLLVSVLFCTLWLTPFFRLTLVAYFLLQVLYTTKTKHIAILDVLTIATGFVLRVYAGAVVVNLHMNVWFLLTVVSASLFLAVGKRQSERTLLEGKEQGIGETRKTLKRYSQRLLDQYTGMFANATWLTYALFAFQGERISPEGSFLRLFTILPKTLQSQKLLMLTIPFVIFGVMRYMQLVYEDKEGESPEKVILRDRPLLIAVFLFSAVTMVVIYVLS